jgi:predicted metal-binding protein
VENKLPNPEIHVFVCTNERETQQDCSHKGSLNLFRNLKDATKSDPELRERVKVSKSGCLGLCSMGIAAVQYPEGKWLIELKEGDGPTVLEGIRVKLGLPPR